MEAMCKVKVACISHKGKVRETNEDCIGVVDFLTISDLGAVHWIETQLETPSIVMVADGLGGHTGGQFASAFVSRRLLGLARGLNDADGLTDAINATNRALYQEMTAHPDLSRMGATIAGILLAPDCLYGFNVGDSRIYELVPGPYLRLLSTDDVPTSPDYDVSARTGLVGHVVTQCLGGTSHLTDVAPHIVARPIVSGSIVLMCSDGLTDMLDQDEIEDCFDADIAVFARRLFDGAMAAGGKDNISICILEIE